jgi:hypothetical protein
VSTAWADALQLRLVAVEERAVPVRGAVLHRLFGAHARQGNAVLAQLGAQALPAATDFAVARIGQLSVPQGRAAVAAVAAVVGAAAAAGGPRVPRGGQCDGEHRPVQVGLLGQRLHACEKRVVARGQLPRLGDALGQRGALVGDGVVDHSAFGKVLRALVDLALPREVGVADVALAVVAHGTGAQGGGFLVAAQAAQTGAQPPARVAAAQEGFLRCLPGGLELPHGIALHAALAGAGQRLAQGPATQVFAAPVQALGTLPGTLQGTRQDARGFGGFGSRCCRRRRGRWCGHGWSSCRV